MALKVAGYVVQSSKNLFLSRSKRFIRRSRRGSTPGICRAWVHNLNDILKGGDWTTDATYIFPANYNPGTGRVEITGIKMMYLRFVLGHSSR
jgi:hypothetical protein